MNSISRLFSSFKEFYQEINPATLTGAIDVVVIAQPNGDYHGSPFHVRFGKIGVLRSREKLVDIHVNGEPVAIHMKLSDSGEAFFVEPVLDAQVEVPPELSTSPIMLSDSEMVVNPLKRHEVFERDRSVPVDRPRIVEARKALVTTKCSSLEPVLTKDDPSHDVKAQSAVDDIRVRNSVGSSYEYGQRSFSLKEYGSIFSENYRKLWDPRVSRRKPSRKAQQNRFVHSHSWHGFCTDAFSALLLSEELRAAGNKLMFHGPGICRPQGKIKDAQRLSVQANKRTALSSSGKREHADRRLDDEHIFVMEVSDDEGSALEHRYNDTPLLSSKMPSAADLTSELSTGNHIDGFETAARDSRQSDQEIIDKRLKLFEAEDMDGSDSSTQEKLEIVRKEGEALGKVLNEASDWKYEKHLAKQQTAHSNNVKVSTVPDSRSSGWSIWPFARGASRPNLPASRDDEIYLKDLELIDPAVAASYLNKRFTSPEKERERGCGDREAPVAVVVAGDECHSSGVGVTTQPCPLAEPAKECTAMFSDRQPADRVAVYGSAPPCGTSPNDDVGYDSNPSSETGSEEGQRTFFLFPDSISDISLSTCGCLEQQDQPDYSMRFEEKAVTIDQLNSNPDLLFNPEVVFRIHGRYYNLRVVLPILVAHTVFRRSLNPATMAHLLGEHQPKPSHEESRGRGVSSWFSWRRTKDASQSDHTALHSQPLAVDISEAEERDKSLKEKPATVFHDSDYDKYEWDHREALSDSEVDTIHEPSKTKSRFRRSYLLSSDQLKALNLQPGPNMIRFSVTTKYQGTCWCECHIFLWQWDDKIVISDIDGTITKSDVLGQILPIVGGQWAQVGVAELFTRIVDNGYRILYLSARAIGQSQWTKDYLRSVKQDQRRLPDGPLLLSPTSMMMALHREIIEKKPEVFKTSCLSDIRSLFPESINPFYAGFGNKPNDVIAYKAAGVPSHRIFIINPNGLVELVSKQLPSSYRHIADMVDLIFPPLNRNGLDNMLRSTFFEPEKFSSYTFWRVSPCEITLHVIDSQSDEHQRPE